MSEPADLCLSADERTGWDFWDARTIRPARLPCVDCTAEFRAQMTKEGLCNGSPVIRYCDRCKRWSPLIPAYWVIQMRPAGTRIDSLGRTYLRATAVTSYTCRACRRTQQLVRWHRNQKILTDEIRHERRLASWRAYRARVRARKAVTVTRVTGVT